MNIWEEMLSGMVGAVVLVVLIMVVLPRVITSAIEKHHARDGKRHRRILADFADYLSTRLIEAEAQRNNLDEYHQEKEIYPFKIKQVNSDIEILQARSKFTGEDVRRQQARSDAARCPVEL